MDLYTSWACPLLAHGHRSVRPILQGPSDFIFILFSCPLRPFWSVIIEKKGQMGWQLKIYGLTVKGLSVDGSRFMGWQLKWLGWRFKWLGWRFQWLGWWFKWLGWQFKCEHHQLYKHLIGHPEAIMAHDTCRSLIGFYLRSKCCFIFHALFLYIPESSLLISLFSVETYCQSTTVILVRLPYSYYHNDRRHTPSVRLVYPLLIQKIGKCSFSKSLADSLFILIS